jgi:hypothetical protein
MRSSKVLNLMKLDAFLALKGIGRKCYGGIYIHDARKLPEASREVGNSIGYKI